MRAKFAIYILIMLMLAASTQGLGIAPGTVEVEYDKADGRDHVFYIVNNEHKDMQVVLYAQGELAKFATLEDAILDISAEDDTKSFSLQLDPKELSPGKHKIELVAMELPEKAEGATVVATRQAVISNIIIAVPHRGKHAEAELVIPKASQDEPIDFVIKVKNRGKETIEDCHARLEIYSPANELVASLQSDSKMVKPGQLRELVANYNSGLNKGRYFAKAIVSYDGEELELEQAFEVGDLRVDIVNIYVQNFRLGEIAKFDIIVENKWNEPIPDVFADMEIKDSFGKTETRFKTAEIDLQPFSTDIMNAYWDTKDTETGLYKAKLTLHFLGHNAEKSIVLDVKEDSISIDLMPTGRAIAAQDTETDSFIIILIVASMIFNGILFIIFARRKR